MVSSNLAIDYQGGLSHAWDMVATFVPKLAMFLLILAIGWIVARIVASVIRMVLNRVGFDHLVERGGIKDMLSRSSYDATGILAKLGYYAVMLIALQLAFGVWGPNAVSNLLTSVVSWLPKAFIAIVIVVVTGWIARMVKDLVANALSGLSYGRTLGMVASAFIWVVGVLAALGQIGIATAVIAPLLWVGLATLGGIAVVGAGGGLIRPMAQRWDRWLGTIENELPSMRGHSQGYSRGQEDASTFTTTTSTTY